MTATNMFSNFGGFRCSPPLAGGGYNSIKKMALNTEQMQAMLHVQSFFKFRYGL